MKLNFAEMGVPLVLCAAVLHGQHVSVDAALRTSDRSYVQAAGDMTISAKPDQALIDIGVVTLGTTAGAVAAENAKDTDAVLVDLRKILPAGANIRTIKYSLAPNYQLSKSGAPPTVKGYRATNVVEVTVNNFARPRVAPRPAQKRSRLGWDCTWSESCLPKNQTRMRTPACIRERLRL
jgi:uncharacterized protein YggE